MSQYRVALVDDQELVRAGLAALIERFAEFTVVAQAADGAEVPDLLARETVDILVMDIAMKQVSGLTALARLRQASQDLPVIMLSMYGTRDYILRAFSLGASAYLLKHAAVPELRCALHSVIVGEAYLSQSISRDLDQFVRRGTEGEESLIDRLSSRQLEILTRLALGMTTSEIARELTLSPKTVESHRRNIFTLLNIRDLPALVFFALRNGIISIDQVHVGQPPGATGPGSRR